jgi:antitoxin PrlF
VNVSSMLRAKWRTTVPKAVVEHLNLKPGDILRYCIVGKRVVLERFEADSQFEDSFLSFNEWASDADRKAYANL